MEALTPILDSVGLDPRLAGVAGLLWALVQWVIYPAVMTRRHRAEDAAEDDLGVFVIPRSLHALVAALAAAVLGVLGALAVGAPPIHGVMAGCAAVVGARATREWRDGRATK